MGYMHLFFLCVCVCVCVVTNWLLHCRRVIKQVPQNIQENELLLHVLLICWNFFLSK